MTLTHPRPGPHPVAPAQGAGPGDSAGPGELATIARRVRHGLDELLRRERARWVAVDPDLADLLASLRRLALAGGKRLRPAFCHWGFVAAGGDGDDPAARAPADRAGVALELLHAFALVHDDVMDGAGSRRGEPTAHVEHGERHRHQRWRGESRRFGESVAVLVGDLAHALAAAAMTGQAPETLAVWHELQVELVMGQYLDVLGTARTDRSDGKARLVMQLKSGRYTVERPLQLGAAIAGAPGGGTDPAVTAALAAYGRPLGQAFQLRDDVLGAFGSTERTGKPVGDDLRAGKPTTLLAHATVHASATQRAVLERVGAPDLADAEVGRIQQVLVDTGALDAAEAATDRLRADALAALARPELRPPARRALTELATFVAGRAH